MRTATERLVVAAVVLALLSGTIGGLSARGSGPERAMVRTRRRHGNERGMRDVASVAVRVSASLVTINVQGAPQVVDTTARDASPGRRELTSRHTKVENVLTLLNAK